MLVNARSRSRVGAGDCAYKCCRTDRTRKDCKVVKRRIRRTEKILWRRGLI